MSVKVNTRTTYTPACDSCGWRGLPQRTRDNAELDIIRHPCGEHREASGSGRHRGILGGYNYLCICGHSYNDPAGEPFACPRATP